MGMITPEDVSGRGEFRPGDAARPRHHQPVLAGAGDLGCAARYRCRLDGARATALQGPTWRGDRTAPDAWQPHYGARLDDRAGADTGGGVRSGRADHAFR